VSTRPFPRPFLAGEGLGAAAVVDIKARKVR
jgi:hypothetical protein